VHEVARAGEGSGVTEVTWGEGSRAVSLRTQLAAAVSRVTHHQPPSQSAVPDADAVSEAFLRLMSRPWRAQPEDTLGGWCVTLAEDPRSPADGALAIAMFLSREVALHIADIHNQSLPGSQDVIPLDRALRAPVDVADPAPDDAVVDLPAQGRAQV
jgi:hypothetical protein